MLLVSPFVASVSESVCRGVCVCGRVGDDAVRSLQMDDTREDYSHLPPNQQKKRLNQKIASIRATIAKESSER